MYKADRAFALVQNRAFGTRRVRVVFGSASGRFGAEQTIHTSRPDTQGGLMRAAVNERGDIAVLHRAIHAGGSSRIVLLERPAGGRFGAAQTVEAVASCRCYSEPRSIAVAIGQHGELALAYERAGSMMVRTRPAGGRLGPAVRVGESYEARALQTAISARGAVWVTWFDNPADGGPGRAR